MRYPLEHLATIVAAISGAMAARGKQVDLFGVLVLALVTALGGGTLRDVILDVRPVFWIADTTFLFSAAAGALLVFLAARFRDLSGLPLLIADAFALALFTVIGVEKSLQAGVAPVVCIVMGVMTGAAGGMVRDVLTGEIPLVLRSKVNLYATAALCGAAVFVALEGVIEPRGLRLIAAGTTLVLRLAAIAWRIRLPDFVARDGTGLPS